MEFVKASESTSQLADSDGQWFGEFFVPRQDVEIYQTMNKQRRYRYRRQHRKLALDPILEIPLPEEQQYHHGPYCSCDDCCCYPSYSEECEEGSSDGSSSRTEKSDHPYHIFWDHAEELFEEVGEPIVVANVTSFFTSLFDKAKVTFNQLVEVAPAHLEDTFEAVAATQFPHNIGIFFNSILAPVGNEFVTDPEAERPAAARAAQRFVPPAFTSALGACLAIAPDMLDDRNREPRRRVQNTMVLKDVNGRQLPNPLAAQNSAVDQMGFIADIKDYLFSFAPPEERLEREMEDFNRNMDGEEEDSESGVEPKPPKTSNAFRRPIADFSYVCPSALDTAVRFNHGKPYNPYLNEGLVADNVMAGQPFVRTLKYTHSTAGITDSDVRPDANSTGKIKHYDGHVDHYEETTYFITFHCSVPWYVQTWLCPYKPTRLVSSYFYPEFYDIRVMKRNISICSELVLSCATLRTIDTLAECKETSISAMTTIKNSSSVNLSRGLIVNHIYAQQDSATMLAHLAYAYKDKRHSDTVLFRA
jgi:hypothetical protein